MGLEWVLISLMTVVSLWLGMDACRESKRLHDRLSRLAPRPTALHEPHPSGEWTYWPMTTSADDASIGPRF